MSFWNKLFGGDKEAEKNAKDLLNALFGEKKDTKKTSESVEKEEGAPVQEASKTAETSDSEYSFYEDVPDEENQYNFKGSYEQYFEHVFAEDFPALRYEKSYINDYGKRRVVYTFFNGAAKVLAVELMPESSEAKKFKNDCKKANLPYLRFYYDHEGWWNTRSYVVGRISDAIK
ncbi:MAG: hypothetical protein J5850_00530 [Clostridia bacterium]|nr:hypothetical protein [Clostridia bacterium]